MIYAHVHSITPNVAVYILVRLVLSLHDIRFYVFFVPHFCNCFLLHVSVLRAKQTFTQWRFITRQHSHEARDGDGSEKDFPRGDACCCCHCRSRRLAIFVAQDKTKNDCRIEDENYWVFCILPERNKFIKFMFYFPVSARLYIYLFRSVYHFSLFIPLPSATAIALVQFCDRNQWFNTIAIAFSVCFVNAFSIYIRPNPKVTI